jgi:hypothetical protein
MDSSDNVTQGVPVTTERRRRELALARLLAIAVELIRGTGDADLDIRIENAKDMIREFRHGYPEAREI